MKLEFGRNDTTERQEVMEVQSIVLALCYFGLMVGPVLMNVYRYVYMQQRYKVWAVLTYYMQTVLFLGLIIASYTLYAIDYSRE